MAPAGQRVEHGGGSEPRGLNVAPGVGEWGLGIEGALGEGSVKREGQNLGHGGRCGTWGTEGGTLTTECGRVGVSVERGAWGV